MNKSSFLAFDLYSIHEHNKIDSLHHGIIICIPICIPVYLFICLSIFIYLSFWMPCLLPSRVKFI